MKKRLLGFLLALVLLLGLVPMAAAASLQLGNTVSVGSFDSVTLTDTNDDAIDADLHLDGTTISVGLPRSVDASDTVRMHFSLTQNSMDGSTPLPFVSKTNKASGSSSQRAVNNIVTYLDTTLASGKGTAAVYFYDHVPKATTNTYTTYTIEYEIANSAPRLTGVGSKTDVVTAGAAYTVDLAAIFSDADGDALTYTVSLNGTAAVEADAIYSYTPTVAATDVLVFTASDGMDTAPSYTLTLHVSNTTETYDVTVYVPEGLSPKFYATAGYDESGVDTFLADAPITAEAGATADGFTAYTIKVPATVSTISFRDEVWGGMSMDVAEGQEIYLEDFQGYIDHIHNGSYVTAEQAEFLVKDNNGHYAVSGSSAADEELDGVTYHRFLLAATGNDATYTLIAKGSGDLADIYGETIQNLFALEPDGQTFAALSLTVSNPIYVIVPEGAEAALYRQYNNYNTAQIAHVTKATADGMTTFTFKNPGGNLSWRAWWDNKITKAGFLGWNQDTVTVTWDDTDPAADTQIFYSTDTTMGLRYDATAIVNVNAQNHLVLSENESFRLRGYRWWQIINHDVSNIMVEPDFNYEIVTGDHIISIDAKDGGNATGNWMDITAKGTGMAVVEVGFDALAVSGMTYSDTPSFVYGACDPDRTALVVVSVGEKTIDADFGIVGANDAASWDVEFDTVYFLGDRGALTLTPAVSGTLSVSHDKGKTWQTLTSADGTYTAPITAGNNILKLETADGVDYQVVRGSKVTASLTNVTEGKNTSDPVAAGDTVQITFDGIHHAMSKMSAVYNPGYGGGSTILYSAKANGAAAGSTSGVMTQYQLPCTTTFTVPAELSEGDTVELTGGYIRYNAMGSAIGAHRSITDAGLGTNTSATSRSDSNCRLPDLKLTVGSTTVVDGSETTVETFSIAGSNMTLGNELILNFLLKQADVTVDGLTAYVTHHAVNADTGAAEDLTYSYPQADWVAQGSYYKIPIAVAASQMTDVVDIVIKDAEGNVHASDYSDSVCTYFGRLYAATSEALAKPLMVDMLNYGASAQNYFGYRTDSLANAGLTEEQQALATPAVECTNSQEKDTNYYGTTLSLKDCIELNFIFKNLSGKDISTMYAEVSFINSLGEAKSATLSGDALTSQANGARCQVKVAETVLADASELVTVTLYDADGNAYATAKDSVQSYVQRYVAKNGDDTGLYGNIMKLSVSALNYIKSK